MRGRIYKYHLPVQEEVVLEVHELFRPLHVGEQNGQLCLWALTDPSASLCDRRFLIYGTGHAIDTDSDFEYVGTVQMSDGLVWHVVDGGRVNP